jgi:MoaA/NifB/PqqE/SkfB family radical SAM enzyme
MTVEKPKVGFYIDVFSSCNLRCPSCLVGNKFGRGGDIPKGLMTAEHLGRILDKATSECIVPWVGLFNWTEPLLHPKLPDLVKEVVGRDLYCMLSSNLNLRPDFDFEALLAARPDWFRISLSGFTQDGYGRGHAGGDIEVVKSQMQRLSAACDSVSSKTSIQVLFHVYKHNVKEADEMRAFAVNLGFAFEAIYAQMYPIEKLLKINRGEVSADDRQLMDMLVVPVDKALIETSLQPINNCFMMDDQMVLDVSGRVVLCCGTSLNRENIIGDYMTLDFAEIQRRKNLNNLCTECMAVNVPAYFNGASYLEREKLIG